MKILFITPQLPFPPHQGTTIRNYNLIAALSQQHTIDLLTFTPTGEPIPADHPLYRFCRRIGVAAQPQRPAALRILDTVRSPLPDMALRLESRAMRALVQEWVTRATTVPADADRGYDIVQVEGIEVAQYGRMVVEHPAWGTRKPALVFDNHNCEYCCKSATPSPICVAPPAGRPHFIAWCSGANWSIMNGRFVGPPPPLPP
ncbi:MAG: hypothetical protein R2911_03995 [Caldilineaceae bacterium]